MGSTHTEFRVKASDLMTAAALVSFVGLAALVFSRRQDGEAPSSPSASSEQTKPAPSSHAEPTLAPMNPVSNTAVEAPRPRPATETSSPPLNASAGSESIPQGDDERLVEVTKSIEDALKGEERGVQKPSKERQEMLRELAEVLPGKEGVSSDTQKQRIAGKLNRAREAFAKGCASGNASDCVLAKTLAQHGY